MSATRWFVSLRSASARFVAIVVRPAPPFGEKTAITSDDQRAISTSLNASGRNVSNNDSIMMDRSIEVASRPSASSVADQGYVSGDGTVRTLPVAERDRPLRFSGRTLDGSSFADW